MTRNKLFFLLLGAFFLPTRLLFLFHFPLFFDEAIYIRWSQYIIDDWFWKFISLSDGKQPLFIWLMNISLRIIPDPVIGGRIISVLAGLGSIVGIFLLSRELFGKTVAKISAVLYLITPFYLLHDGLALMDGLLLTCSIYACYFTVKIAQSPHYKLAVLTGISIGLGLLTKSSAMFSLYLLPAGLLLLKKSKKIVGNYVFFVAIAIAIALAFEAILRLSSYYDVIAQKNSLFLFTLDEVEKNYATIFAKNGSTFARWLFTYIGLPTIILAIVSLFYKEKRKDALFLSLYFLVPVASLTFFGKQLYPRYLLFMTFPLIILASYTITNLSQKLAGIPKKLFFCTILLFLLPLLFIDFLLLTTPHKAPLPEIDKWQFFTGEPSGIGLKKAVGFFNERANKEILILVDKPLGNPADGVAIYFHRQKNVHVVGLDGITKETIRTHYREIHPQALYLLLSWQSIPGGVTVQQQLEIQRPGARNKNWKIYEVDLSSVR